jgi:hypothetical protein
MGSNSIHLIIDPLAFSVQLSFYSESREFIGDDAKGPTGGIGRGSIVSECNNFWRSAIFIPFAERTKSTPGPSFF